MTIEEENCRDVSTTPATSRKIFLIKVFLLESTPHWLSVLFACTKNKFILPFSILIWSSKLICLL